MKRLYSWQGWAIVDEQDRAMRYTSSVDPLMVVWPTYNYELFTSRRGAESWSEGHKVVKVTITVKVEDE